MKRTFVLTLLFIFALASLVSAANVKRAVVERLDVPSFIGYVPDEIVVQFDRSVVGQLDHTQFQTGRTGVFGLDQLAEEHQAISVRQQFQGAQPKLLNGQLVDLSGWHKIKFAQDISVEHVVEEYMALSDVIDAQPIGIHTVYATPNDDWYSSQWHLNQASGHDIDAPEAWDIETGDEAVIVAMLDTGVRYYHKDLGGVNASASNSGAARGNMWINWAEKNGSAGVDDDMNGYVDDWIGYDFVDGTTSCWSGEDCDTKDNDPRDFNGHGTHCAGNISAINNNGYATCAPSGGWGNGSLQEDGNGVKVMACRVGWSGIYFYIYEVGYVRMDFCAEAFYYAADNGAKIASCSWGSSNSGGIAAAATYFINNGGMIFKAAGNDDSQSVDYLCGRSDVISVAATDKNDCKASFSNYGTWVDISAPGVGIYSLYHNHDDPDNDYVASMNGTSMATPLAASVAALIWSKQPTWTASQIEQQLYDSADNIEGLACNSSYGGKLGAGRINAYNAVNFGPPPPASDFSGSPTSGCVPLTVNFTNLSTGDITSWDWTFGDGGTSTAQNPTHQYTSGGTFTVSLTVIGPGGSDTETKTNYVTVNGGPTADFSGSPISGTAPLTVNFTDLSTGNPTIWDWNFGDGGTSTAQNPTHQYTDPGTYTVTLTASNACGSDQEVKTDHITVDPCIAPGTDFSGSPNSGDAPLTVNFTDLSTGNPTTWDWNFGDGGTSTAQNPTHQYTDPGTYTVTLTASNACGSDDEVKVDYVTVTEFSGFCDDFNDGDVSDWTVVAGTWSVVSNQYDGLNTGGKGYTLAPVGDVADGVITVDWTSLDGEGWTNGMVLFAWRDANNYRVADCRDGGNKWFIREYIGGRRYNRAYLAEPINTNQQYYLELIIDQDGLVTVKVDGVEKVSYNFGDVVTGRVGLCVERSHSQFDNFCVSTEAPLSPPIAKLSGTPTSGCAPLAVNFTDESTGDITSWDWTFGDGGTSTAQSPSHQYSNAGTYTVSLTVTGPGGSDTETKTDYITVKGGPIADFSGSPRSGTVPLTINFTDLSTGNPTIWDWNFGDGGTSNEQNPVYEYQNEGTYTVSLTVTNACGNDTETKVDYVTVTAEPPPGATFSGSPTSGCAPLTVTFTDESTGNITSWDWTFGDGGTSTAQNPSHQYTNPGTYTVSLTVTGPGGSDSETKTDYITLTGAPTADFVGSPTTGPASLTVNFTDQSIGGPTSWSWDFGDGGTSTQQNPTYEFQDPGTYTVSLTATNACGNDTETKIDYITANPAGGNEIGEVGQITRDQGKGADWYTVTFNRSYMSPVVVMRTLTFNESNPTHLRVRNVTAHGFEWQMEEWNYLDGNHTTEDCPYIVMEAGVHILEDGTKIEAGTASANNKGVSVIFSQPFSSTPILITGVMSQNDWAACITRTRNLSSTGFQIGVQEEEAADQVHGTETVAWIAVEVRSGTNDGVDFEAGRTSNSVTHEWYTIKYSPAFSSAPILLCHDDTFDGKNTCGTRYRNNVATSVEVFIEEEQSKDAEISHTTEVVSYLAWGAAGDIIGSGTIKANFGPASKLRPTIIPGNFELIQNYPNPFNPETAIDYAIPVDCTVTLDVYNVLGQKVTTLVDEYQSSGIHSVHWNAADMPTGVYFYRITASEFTAVKKMILMK